MSITVRAEGRQVLMHKESGRAYCGRCVRCDRAAMLFRPDNLLWCWACGTRMKPDAFNEKWRKAWVSNYGQAL